MMRNLCHISKRVVACVVLLCWTTLSIAQEIDRTQDCPLQQLNSDRVKRAFNDVVPAQDPYFLLNRMSCIDAILSTRLSLGLFFDLESVINELIQKYINQACAKVQAAWSSVARQVERSFDQRLNVNDYVLQRFRW